MKGMNDFPGEYRSELQASGRCESPHGSPSHSPELDRAGGEYGHTSKHEKEADSLWDTGSEKAPMEEFEVMMKEQTASEQESKQSTIRPQLRSDELAGPRPSGDIYEIMITLGKLSTQIILVERYWQHGRLAARLGSHCIRTL